MGVTGSGPRIGDRVSNPVQRALVVDDSCLSGAAINQAKELVKNFDFHCDFAAVYTSDKAKDQLDYYFKVLETPRVFEWNVFHHSILERSCLDIDGVLCPDPTRDENDDGPSYLGFVSQTPGLFAPTTRVGSLVTNRLEKYRKQTEDWLGRMGVDYGELIMHQAKSKAERQAGPRVGHKAEVFSDSKWKLFIESDKFQSEEIHRLTGKPVLCVDTMEMICSKML